MRAPFIFSVSNSTLSTCNYLRFAPDNHDTCDNYNIWAVALTEVEVDILTGEKHIRSCDIIEDVGLSTSPLVSIRFKRIDKKCRAQKMS